MSLYRSRKDYVKYKVSILDELGMHDTAGLKEKLYPIAAGAGNRKDLEVRVDRACRKLLMNFYDGDRTYAFKRGA